MAILQHIILDVDTFKDMGRLVSNSKILFKTLRVALGEVLKNGAIASKSRP